MTDETTIADRLAKAAVEQAAFEGWSRLSVAAVAEHAGVPLGDAYAAVADKPALLRAILARTDRLVLADGPAAADEPPRDRLFEILMRRFDVLQADREGYQAILRELPRDPVSGVLLLPHMATAMGWMLEAAHVSSAGLFGSLRIKALSLVYLNTLRIWMDDDSADMARTMATLDSGLRQAEAWAERLSAFSGEGRSRRQRAADEDFGEAPSDWASTSGSGTSY
jgi:AcrR family transcriptional regulator